LTSYEPPRGPFDPDDTDTDRRRPDEREEWRRTIRTDVDSLTKAMGENTQLTKESLDTSRLAAKTAGETKKALDLHTAATADVVAAYAKVQKGIAVMDALGRAGEWIVDRWKPILIIFVAIKVLMHGGSWGEAWGVLEKIFKGE
jgi:hypothetical protein